MKFILKQMVAGALTVALLFPVGLSPAAATPRAALQYSYLQAFASSGTFVPPYTGKYKIYCVGKSADGSPSISGGGGGSGGVAVSELTLTAGQSYPVTVDGSQSAFASFLYATAAPQPTGMTGGAGGLAFGGNVANEGGFVGGNGGAAGTGGWDSTPGENGLNGGMKGGAKGITDFGNRSPYGGSGGGARLPAVCSYVSSAYTSTYQAAGGDHWRDPDGGGATRHYAGNPGTPYPPFTLSSSMVLFGGGGGANWSLPATAGTPGVVIIEKCTDNDNPVVTGATLLNNWAQSYVTTITAVDATSGVAEYAISTTNAAPTVGWTASNQFNITANGTYYAWARDNAGRISAGFPFYVSKLDLQIPVASSVNWRDEWAKNITVTVAGTDAESGVAAFACTSSNIAPAGGWQSTAQFTLSQNGSYYAWVKDQVGRVSLGKQFTLNKVDVSPPTVVSCNFSDGGLKATIKAADVGSGVKGVYVNDRFIAGETAVCELTDSDLTLKIQAEDMVGHKSTVRTENVPDQIPPTIEKITFAKDAASVQIVVSDRGNSKLKGVYVNEMLYAVDAMGKATVDVDNQSVFEIRVQAQDNAGNKSVIRTESVPDVLPPVVKSIVFSPDSKKAVITATDTGSSGLKGISVNGKLIEGSPVEYTLPENQWDLSVFAEDNAGNKSATVSEVAPDVIPPVIQSITFSADSKMVKVIASDLGSSGLKGIYINGKFFAGTSANYTFPEGHWGLSVYAEDNAGNKSAMVDKIAPDTIPPRIDSVTFSPDNLRATINASDEGSAGLAFVEINDVKYPIVNGKYTYKIPMDTQFLNISVIDGAENASELLVKRVPGWSIEIDTIAITSVEFAEDKKSAVIRADTSDPNREIIGIYVNNLLHRVNPATVTIPDGTEQLVCQAIDNQGDKSRVVVRDVPKDEIPKEEVPVPPIRPEKPEKDKKTRITITQPAWTNGSKPVRVRVTASDADDGIDDISVKTDYDPTWEDITEEGYFILTQDAMVTVRATNGAGEETTKSQEIRCFDDTPPTVSLRNGGDGILTVTFRDDKSGVKSVTINGQVFSGKELSKGYITYMLKEQTDEVRVYAEDNAGNRSDREELTITLPPVPMTAKPSTRPAVVAQPENPVNPSDGSGGGYSTTTTTTTSRRTKNAQFFKKMQQLHNSPRDMEEEAPNTVLRMKDSPDNRSQRMLAVGVSCGLFLLLATGAIAALIVARRRRTPANEEIL